VDDSLTPERVYGIREVQEPVQDAAPIVTNLDSTVRRMDYNRGIRRCVHDKGTSPVATLAQRRAIDRHGCAEVGHGDLLKTFTSFGLHLSNAFTAKPREPVSSVAAHYADRVGWVGCNC